MMAQNGKVQIRIGKGVLYKNLPQKAKDKIAKDLTFDNPKYQQAVKHGQWVSEDTPPYLYFFKVSPDKETFWTPRGYIWFMKRWFRNNNYEVEQFDQTLLRNRIDVSFHGKLRDYQEESVNNLIKRYPLGVLEAGTGSGKTVMGLAVIARRKQPTLIIVHTKELLYQWQARIKQFLRYDAGLLGDGKCEIKDITVGIINTVKNKTGELSERFGQIIVDECHRCPSTVWTDTLSEFSARFYLGLSATPYRKDGLGNAIYCHVGPMIHRVNKKKLHDSGAVLKPQIVLVKTNYKFGNHWSDEKGAPYSTIIKNLTENSPRNDLICRTITDDLKQFNQNVLVVSDRVTHCKEIAHILNMRGIKAHVLHGGVSNKERKQIVADVQAGLCKVLIATLSLIGEGFDAPNLCSLFITTPISFSGRLIQTVGRVLRPKKGKIARVYDFRDENVKVLRNSGFRRNKMYKKEWG